MIEVDIGRPIGILQDLQGSKFRLGSIAVGALKVTAGETRRLFLEPIETALHLPNPEVFAAVAPRHRILIGVGRIALKVIATHGAQIETKVIQGGKITDRKGVNLPDCLPDLPVMTEKDRDDLRFGLEHGVEWVSLSFVQVASDLEKIRQAIDRRAGLIAKIETPSALADNNAIFAKADAIMITRGDLGVETPPEHVLGHQKSIIALCLAAARPVIVATQVLESMTGAATPTRAEASGVATAVYNGADAVMLSADTARRKDTTKTEGAPR